MGKGRWGGRGEAKEIGVKRRKLVLGLLTRETEFSSCFNIKRKMLTSLGAFGVKHQECKFEVFLRRKKEVGGSKREFGTEL